MIQESDLPNFFCSFTENKRERFSKNDFKGKSRKIDKVSLSSPQFANYLIKIIENGKLLRLTLLFSESESILIISCSFSQNTVKLNITLFFCKKT